MYPYLPLEATDLQTFLALPSVNADRANMLLTAAQSLCESIVAPLPDGAAAIVLTVAARAYSNPQQLADASLGTAHLQFGQIPGGGPIGGLYLSRGEKATLRRLGGGSSAYSVSSLPTGTNAAQSLNIAATGGTFTLGLGGAITAPLLPSLSAADLLAALSGLPTVGNGNVMVTGANPYTVTFINNLATTDVPTLTVDGSLLTGTATVVTTTRGVPAPGQNLPAWDKDYYGGPGILGRQL